MVSLQVIVGLLTVMASVSAQRSAESPRTGPIFYDPYLFSGLFHQIFRLTNDITRFGVGNGLGHVASNGIGHVTTNGAHFLSNDIGKPVAVVSHFIGNGIAAASSAAASGGIRNTPHRVTSFASGNGTPIRFTPNTIAATGIGSSAVTNDPSIRFKPSRVSAFGSASSRPSGTRFVSVGTGGNQGTRFAFASSSATSN